MKAVPQNISPRKLALLFGIMVGMIFIGVVSSPSTKSTEISLTLTYTLSVTPSLDYSAYDPARYGIPNEIEGYQVIAVITSENTPCELPGTKNVVVQVSAQSVENFLTQESSNTDTTIDKLKKEMHVTGVTYVGPGISREDFLLEQIKWNEQMSRTGCLTPNSMIVLTATLSN